MCIFCLHDCFTNFLSFIFLLKNYFHHCLLTVLRFWFKPSHCLPVTMWIYLSHKWNRTNTSSFLVVSESLNALSTFFWFLFYSFLVNLHVFLYFCAFWRKTPAEGRVLSCDIWMKKRRCGIFNLSRLIVTHFLWQCCMHMPFFGRKVH